MQTAKTTPDKLTEHQPVKHFHLRKFLLAAFILGLILFASIMTIPVTGNIVPQNDLGALLGLVSIIFAGFVAWKASAMLMK